MPYNPANANAFRSILKKLGEDQYLTSEKIINLVLRHRAQKKDKALPAFGITPNSLNRFKRGERIRDVPGLHEIYCVLEVEPTCRKYFEAQPFQVESFNSALARFFSDTAVKSTYDPSVLVVRLPGAYTMYAPVFPPSDPPGLIGATLLEITATNSGLNVTETQNFIDPPYHQHDAGAMASFAKFVYFLMKEDDPGTAVKFGFITTVYPYTSVQSVDWFSGIIFTSSNLAIFPPKKFFCTRDNSGKEHTSALYPINGVPDKMALTYLKQRLKLPQ